MMPATHVLHGKGYRLANKALGDDPTLSRFARVDEADGGRKRRKHQPKLPGLETGFVQEARTKFPKARRDPDDHMLVSGHNNIKIGRDVRKGKLRGYWIYTLSLEERATCPSSCQHWQSCYGNNMPFAKRVNHRHPDFLKRLEAAIEVRLYVRGRKGILVRLHALGDFFSVEYVWFWRRMLATHERLAIYGYSAHAPDVSPIGDELARLNEDSPDRCMIRFSNGGLPIMSTVSIGAPESCPPTAFICPEQTAKTRCCATCGACWGTNKNVAFLEH